MSGFNFEDGSIYKIINDNSEKVIGIDGEWKNEDNGREVIIFTDSETAKDQLFLIFKLVDDENLLMFANKKSGKVIGVYGGAPATVNNGTGLIQWTASKTAEDQIWQTKRVPGQDNLYTIRNYYSGSIVGVDGDVGHNTENSRQLILWSDTGAADQKWKFSKRDSISLPKLPNVEVLKELENYTKDSNTELLEQYPKTPVLTHVARVPYLFISDHGWSPKNQIQETPYYTIEKSQRWVQQTSKDIISKSERNTEHEIERTNQIKKTLSLEFGFQTGAEGGVDLKGISAKISRELNLKLGYSKEEIEITKDRYKEEDNRKNPNDKTHTYTEYAKEITMTLKRMDGTPVKTFTYINPNTSRILDVPSKQLFIK